MGCKQSSTEKDFTGIVEDWNDGIMLVDSMGKSEEWNIGIGEKMMA